MIDMVEGPDNAEAPFPWPEGSTVPCQVWRGGTSKGLIFRTADLPQDPSARDRMLLAALGSPDARQVDGLGGGHPLTSKVAIVEASADPRYDVSFTFAQVGVDRALVDYSGTCGNISSAIGPWAVLEGQVSAHQGEASVRVWNTNTERGFVAHVSVRDGRPTVRGDYIVDGVPRPGSAVRLEFLRPEGGATGRLLPTGHLRDTVRTSGDEVEVTIVDVGNLTGMVRLDELGMDPGDATEALLTSENFRQRLMRIREEIGVMAGLAPQLEDVPAHVPKIVAVAPPAAYVSLNGGRVEADQLDLRAWALTMGRLHLAFPVTAGMATAVAARLSGSVAGEVAVPRGQGADIRIGHPSGVIAVGADVVDGPGGIVVERVVVGRTARLLMTGQLALP
jgi:2-methylaconitate cis-trans-isomerase PrpF